MDKMSQSYISSPKLPTAFQLNFILKGCTIQRLLNADAFGLRENWEIAFRICWKRRIHIEPKVDASAEDGATNDDLYYTDNNADILGEANTSVTQTKNLISK
jgi:hypothetical protein